MYPINDSYRNYIKNSLSLSAKSKIEVDGITYTGSVIKTYPKIKHKSTALIGTFPSKTCSFEIFDINNSLDFEEKEIKVYRGLYINGETQWIPQGIFIPKSSNITTDISTKTIHLSDVSDKTQLFDTKYETNLSWLNGKKHTGLEIISEICTNLNVELENSNFNWSTYEFKQPNFSSSITYREVVRRIAEIGGSIAYINRYGKLEIKNSTNTNEIIDRKRYTKLSKEKIVGPFNTIVLGKDGISDDIIFPAEIQNERVEWKILDNPFVDLYREEMIEEVANYIIGKSYIPFELNDFVDGFYFDLNDVINIKDKNGNSFAATILNYESASRIKSNISADTNGKTVTNYNLAGSQKQSTDDVKLEVDHINKRVDALSVKVDDLTDYIKTETGISFLKLNDTMLSDGSISKLSIFGFDVKPLYPNMAYPSNYTYPGVLNFYTLIFSNEKIIYSSTLPTADNQTELYNVGGLNGKFYRCNSSNEWVEETDLNNIKLLYINAPFPLRTLNIEGVLTYDELLIEDNVVYIIQRIGLNSNNQPYVLDKEVRKVVDNLTLPTFANTTYITLKYWTNLNYECTYMVKNDFTSNFATKSETQAIINITDELNLEVQNKCGKDEVVNQLNISKDAIKIKGNRFLLEADNITIDLEGNILLNNGSKVIGGDGLLTNLQFVSSGELEFAGFRPYDDMTGGINDYASIVINAEIPSNFVIVSAIITLIHSPVNYYDGMASSPYYFWGYSRKFKAYKTSNLNGYYKKAVLFGSLEPENEGNVSEINGAFNVGGFTAKEPTDSSHETEVVYSSDIKDSLSLGWNRILLRSSDVMPSGLNYENNAVACAKKTGSIIGILNVIGYMAFEE